MLFVKLPTQFIGIFNSPFYMEMIGLNLTYYTVLSFRYKICSLFDLPYILKWHCGIVLLYITMCICWEPTTLSFDMQKTDENQTIALKACQECEIFDLAIAPTIEHKCYSEKVLPSQEIGKLVVYSWIIPNFVDKFRYNDYTLSNRSGRIMQIRPVIPELGRAAPI